MQVQKIQNNNNYNTNFGAKLNVKNLNHWRWNKIAEKFEQATKEFPNDTITIKSVFGDYNPAHDGVFDGVLSFSVQINNSGEEFIGKARLSDIGTKRLTGLKDNEIVNKLVKMHKIFRTSTDMSVEGQKLIETFMTKFKDSKTGLAKFMFDDGITEARKTSIATGLGEDYVWGRLQL